jgi:outer membrane protein assembly factor BamB
LKLRTVLAVLAALAVTSCSTPEAQPAPPTKSTPAKSTLLRLDVAAEATWTSREVFDAQLRDGTALVIGHRTFQVIDTETGEVRWEVDENTDLGDGATWDASIGTPHLVGEGRDLAVVSGYYRLRDAKYGLALFSAEDGRVLWRTTTDEGAHLRVADDRIALVTDVENGTAADPSDVRTTAYDTRTGDELWDRTGTWPTAIAGDTVLGVNALAVDDSALSVNVDAVAAAFDATTGEPRWDLGSRYRGSEIVYAVGDVALVHATASTKEDAELVLVSTRTGKDVADVGASESAMCVTDRDTTIACFLNGNSVAVYGPDEAVTQVAVQDMLEAVGQNRIFLRGVGNSHYSVDLTGKKLDERLPGEPVAITDDHLVVDEESQRRKLSGYQLG